VIIVGASSGIGAALATRLATEGFTLALLGRRTERLARMCGEINAAAGEVRALSFQHDVNDVQAVPGLLQNVIAQLGGLDLFIYNSGILLPTSTKEYDFELDHRVTNVNYIGALAWLNPVAQLFQSARAGTIVGISSVAGERGRVGNPAYNASKAALTCYLEALRNRLTRCGVHVLTVKPGYVATELNQGKPGMFWVIQPDQAAADICKAIRSHTQELYTPRRWQLVMLVVRGIPSFLFRRLSF
jgi:short-subunit dehydrogenase